MTQHEYAPLLTAKQEYSQQLIQSIDQATDRVLLETMVFDDSGEMASILDAVARARKRGVNVLIIYDKYANLVQAIEKTPQQINKFQSRMSNLALEGAEIIRVGKSRINPFAGRHHAKAVIVDNTSYIGGGINLDGGSFHTQDYMIEFNNIRMSDKLYSTLPEKAVSRDSDDILYSDDTTEILLDAGKPGESLIYDTTCQLAYQASTIHYISKLAPDGDLADILRNKDTYYWHNTISSARSFDKLAIALDQRKFRTANNYTGDAMLHAKAILFEMPDGSHHTITGSHNFNSRGVKFGTQELAIHSASEKIYQAILSFATDLK